MKKTKFFYVIGTLLLLVASSLQCDDSELTQLPYVPESDTAIHSTTFPLIWRTRMEDGEQITVRGSWMTEDMRIDLPQGKTLFLNSPSIETSPAHHTFTVTSSSANCTKTYDLTFTTPLTSTVLPATLYMKQTYATYGGSPVDLSAVFQEDGTAKVDIQVRGCAAYSKTFPIRHFDQGHTWQNFLEEMQFSAAAAEGQSWGYQAFPAKCDASFNKIVLSDTFIQPATQVHASLPVDTEPHLQTPTFSASMIVDDYSCSGARTVYASSVATLASNLGQVLCEAMNMTDDCNIGHLRKPLTGCPAGSEPNVGPVEPRPPFAVVQDNSTSKKDNSASAAAIILIVLLCGVALLVLSILGVFISKRIESLRRKNPPAAVEMFIQSEDQIFTVGDDRSSDVENI